MVFGVAESEDEQEDVGEKNETNLEAGAFLESVTELDGFVDGKENSVAKAKEREDDDKSGRIRSVDLSASGDGSYDGESDRDTESINPEVDANDAAVDVDVVDWDDGLPTLFASFSENLPPSDDEEDVDGKTKDTNRSKGGANNTASSDSLVCG